MSVPEYVPMGYTDRVRRAEWEVPPLPTRRQPLRHPGEPGPACPGRDPLQGRPAPDAGYALSLASRFAGRLELAPGEDERDALTAGAVLGMARASRFGRGPVIGDVQVGLELLGYLGHAPADLVEWRRRALSQIRRDRHRQLLLLGTDPEVLGTTPGEATGLLADWRSLLPARLPGVVPEDTDVVGHRQLAELLGDGRDSDRVRRFLHDLTAHVAAERSRLSRLPATRWAAIERGQHRLLADARELESRADPDLRRRAAAGVADLLAVQALAEDAALEHLADASGGARLRPRSGDDYAVDWACPTPAGAGGARVE